MNIEQEIAKLNVKVENIEHAVHGIDSKLESMRLGSRIAVLEDRQKTVFTLIHGTIGFFGTVVSGIIIWLFTH